MSGETEIKGSGVMGLGTYLYLGYYTVILYLG